MYDGQRITNTNLSAYLNSNICYKNIINHITPLLQNDYGDANDCTLTSITTIIHFLAPRLNVQVIYNQVEQIAQKFGYKGTSGTSPLVIRTIYQKALNSFQLFYNAKSKYLKGIGFTWDFIKNRIGSTGLPIILNLNKDGRNYYSNHTVLIIGVVQTDKKKMLAIFDNWFNTVSYIDYDKLSLIASIQYI